MEKVSFQVYSMVFFLIREFSHIHWYVQTLSYGIDFTAHVRHTLLQELVRTN